MSSSNLANLASEAFQFARQEASNVQGGADSDGEEAAGEDGTYDAAAWGEE
eukprot:CAMPEP_0203923040 /NCGR_PEP_ID=MMETSP0359-20131031/62993_1 /ASSEMBLY_ACC=CAM_ASM_000338 /TAXON_ID=268821 /ORGANISM="Scrippsiella Hangoei, Strain SHTV-5" /LENGTH=50 /DNA_ID=CAMNT_0050851053 /DNA_START=79 /DNA_END=228 /DNA_ORIENTATION=+